MPSFVEQYKKMLSEYQDFEPDRDSESYFKQMINVQQFGLQLLALLENSGLPQEYIDGFAFNVLGWVSPTINLSNITPREAELYIRRVSRAMTLFKMGVPKQYTTNQYWQQAEMHIQNYLIFPLSVGIDGFGRKQLNTRIIQSQENIRAEEFLAPPPMIQQEQRGGYLSKAKRLVLGR